MSAKVLIFGANGFVGPYLAREFAEHGYEVVGSDLAKTSPCKELARYHAGNLLDAACVSDIVSKEKPTVIVNLAAVSSVGQSWRMPAQTMQVNVVGALNLLEAARQQGRPPKVLLIGSSEEYAPAEHLLAETDSIDATNPYGISKVTQERFASLYAERYGLRIYRTRSFNHTGVGQNPNFVIPSWCKQVAEVERSGKPGILHVGNLDVVRDFSDVRDVVRAYRMLVESERFGEVFNVGSGTGRKLREILEIVLALSSQHIDVEVNLELIRPTDTPCIACDRTKIDREVGWHPEIGLGDTLRGIYSSFRDKLS